MVKVKKNFLFSLIILTVTLLNFTIFWINFSNLNPFEDFFSLLLDNWKKNLKVIDVMPSADCSDDVRDQVLNNKNISVLSSNQNLLVKEFSVCSMNKKSNYFKYMSDGNVFEDENECKVKKLKNCGVIDTMENRLCILSSTCPTTDFSVDVSIVDNNSSLKDFVTLRFFSDKLFNEVSLKGKIELNSSTKTFNETMIKYDKLRVLGQEIQESKTSFSTNNILIPKKLNITDSFSLGIFTGVNVSCFKTKKVSIKAIEDILESLKSYVKVVKLNDFSMITKIIFLVLLGSSSYMFLKLKEIEVDIKKMPVKKGFDEEMFYAKWCFYLNFLITFLDCAIFLVFLNIFIKSRLLMNYCTLVEANNCFDLDNIQTFSYLKATLGWENLITSLIVVVEFIKIILLLFNSKYLLVLENKVKDKIAKLKQQQDMIPMQEIMDIRSNSNKKMTIVINRK